MLKLLSLTSAMRARHQCMMNVSPSRRDLAGRMFLLLLMPSAFSPRMSRGFAEDRRDASAAVLMPCFIVAVGDAINAAQRQA